MSTVVHPAQESMVGPTERWAAASGFVFILALVASIVAAGSPPSQTDPAAAITSYFAANRTGVLLSVSLGAVAAMAYLVFAGTLKNRFSPGAAPAILGSAAAAQIALVAMWLALTAGITTAVGSLSPAPETVAALYVTSQKAFSLVDIGATVFLLAAAVAILSGQSFRRWTGWLALLVGALAAADAALGVASQDGLFVPGGPVDSVASLGFLVWIGSMSWTMLRKS